VTWLPTPPQQPKRCDEKPSDDMRCLWSSPSGAPSITVKRRFPPPGKLGPVAYDLGSVAPCSQHQGGSISRCADSNKIRADGAMGRICARATRARRAGAALSISELRAHALHAALGVGLICVPRVPLKVWCFSRATRPRRTFVAKSVVLMMRRSKPLRPDEILTNMRRREGHADSGPYLCL
jgi:hypothetical protein